MLHIHEHQAQRSGIAELILIRERGATGEPYLDDGLDVVANCAFFRSLTCKRYPGTNFPSGRTFWWRLGVPIGWTSQEALPTSIITWRRAEACFVESGTPQRQTVTASAT